MEAQPVRSSGKVILLGEHGVVHGRPALAAGLSTGCRAITVEADEARLVIEAAADAPRFTASDGTNENGSIGGDARVEVKADSPSYPDELRESLRRAFCAVLEGYQQQRPGLEIRISRGLPPGAGLGCSAALDVALVRALDRALDIERDAEQVAEESLRWERVFHGNPSGIDSAIAASGCVALFRRGEPLQRVESAAEPLLVIGHSGQSASTRAVVEQVARLHTERRDEVEEIFDEMAELVLCGSAALGAGDAMGLAELMDRDQVLLRELGISTPRLDQMCQAALRAGAAGAKLTGSGGGGCMIALVEERRVAENVLVALRGMGCGAFAARVGSGGDDK
jgi:mevalonate kinase